MTAAIMLVKDEADIIETTVRHLAWHVDEILVLDNMSSDGTTDILHWLGSELPLFVIPDNERGHYQGRKTSWLAKLALDRRHRWVVPCDADEFWFTSDGRPLRDWLDGIGREHQFVKASILNHVCTALDDPDEPNPVRRIGWRQRTPLDIRWGKVACRTRPDLEIHDGNHSASTHGVGTTGNGLEIRHFPYRSEKHFVDKAVKGLAAFRAAPDLDEGTGAHWRTYGRVIEEEGEEAGRAWFRDAFFSEDPEGDDSLVYDPAKVG